MLPIELFNPMTDEDENNQFIITRFAGKERVSEKLYAIYIAHNKDEDAEYIAVYDCDTIECVLGGICDEISRSKINNTDFFIFDVKHAIDGEPFFVSVGFGIGERIAVSAVTFDWLDGNYV